MLTRRGSEFFDGSPFYRLGPCRAVFTSDSRLRFWVVWLVYSGMTGRWSLTPRQLRKKLTKSSEGWEPRLPHCKGAPSGVTRSSPFEAALAQWVMQIGSQVAVGEIDKQIRVLGVGLGYPGGMPTCFGWPIWLSCAQLWLAGTAITDVGLALINDWGWLEGAESGRHTDHGEQVYPCFGYCCVCGG